jgi:hypothetical protein
MMRIGFQLVVEYSKTSRMRPDRYAQVAQSVEHVLGKDEVGGSIPLLGFGQVGRGRGILQNERMESIGKS